jgi:hypothetical protein
LLRRLPQRRRIEDAFRDGKPASIDEGVAPDL